MGSVRSVAAVLSFTLVGGVSHLAFAEDHSDHSNHKSSHESVDEHTQSALKRASNHNKNLDPKSTAVPTEAIDDSHGPAISNPQVKTADAHGSHAASGAPTANGHATATPGVPAETSLRWLKNGNTRFVKKRFRKDGKDAADRARLTRGQKPHAIVLSCSDSRVPPEIVFDQALGEIFAIRVAGEALDSSVIASIEYAVEHLGTKLIVVMGHNHCGAVQAALSTKEGTSAGSPALDQLVADIQPRLKSVSKDAPSTNLDVESALNADGVSRELVRRSEILRKAVESNGVVIKTALYRLENGKVSFY